MEPSSDGEVPRRVSHLVRLWLAPCLQSSDCWAEPGSADTVVHRSRGSTVSTVHCNHITQTTDRVSTALRDDDYIDLFIQQELCCCRWSAGIKESTVFLLLQHISRSATDESNWKHFCLGDF